MYERKKRPPKRKPDDIPERVPARTEEEAEKRAGGYAMDLALKWLEEGTAPAQIVLHFLKINSQKEQAELEKTRKEIELLDAKKKMIEAEEEQDRKYEEVIKAISFYAGKGNEWEPVPDDYSDYDYDPL